MNTHVKQAVRTWRSAAEEIGPSPSIVTKAYKDALLTCARQLEEAIALDERAARLSGGFIERLKKRKT